MLPARYRGDRGSPDSIEDSRLSRNSTLDEIGVGKLHALLIQFLGMVGVEPTQSEDYTILSRTRIPIPPHARHIFCVQLPSVHCLEDSFR